MLTTRQQSIITMAYLNNRPIYIYADLTIGVKNSKDVLSIISRCSSLEQMNKAVETTLWFYSLDDQA